jgi:hypothetical protein
MRSTPNAWLLELTTLLPPVNFMLESLCIRMFLKDFAFFLEEQCLLMNI